MFLTLIGGEGYAILRNLCAPALPSTKTYHEFATIMKNHMDPTPNVMLERYKFKQCQQGGNEDIKSFVEKLKRASTYCEFGTTQNDNMRDQFVWGVKTEALQNRLLREKELTFEKAVELAIAFEMASKGAAGMAASNKGELPGALNFVAGTSKKGNVGKAGSFTPFGCKKKNITCIFCGKQGHAKSKCYFRDRKCNIYQKLCEYFTPVVQIVEKRC